VSSQRGFDSHSIQSGRRVSCAAMPHAEKDLSDAPVSNQASTLATAVPRWVACSGKPLNLLIPRLADCGARLKLLTRSRALM